MQGWQGPLIYCSQATLQLLQQKWPGVAAEALELEQTHSIALAQPGGTSMELSVTLLDADHCPVRCSPPCMARHSRLPAAGVSPDVTVAMQGAVMFLFETPHQRILYTGDFR